MAIARAVANEPRLLLADEPTGNLDPATSKQVFEALERAIIKAQGVGALIATHNLELARHMDRVVCLENGVLVPIGRRNGSLKDLVVLVVIGFVLGAVIFSACDENKWGI